MWEGAGSGREGVEEKEGEGELKYEKQLFIPKIHTSWLHISQYMAVNGTAVQVFPFPHTFKTQDIPFQGCTVT